MLVGNLKHKLTKMSKQKYRSCHSIEGEIFFNHLNKVGYCCMLTPTGGQPVLYENYCGEPIDWEDFLKKREEHIKLMKNGSSLYDCRGCDWIREKEYPERQRAFRYVLLNNWVKCNLFCCYCTNHKEDNPLKPIQNTKEYDILPVIKDMYEKGMINSDTKFDIAGGEATLDKNFNNLINYLLDIKIKNININTNGTVFSEGIQRGLKEGVISITTSVDAGDAKTYEIMKKNNLYHTTWDNLNKYSQALNCNKDNNCNYVKAKYIIVPGVNDTKYHIYNFLIQAKKTSVSGVILNIDLHWLRANSENKSEMLKVIKLTQYFIKISKLFKLNFQIWAHIEVLIISYNKIAKENPVNTDFIFEKPIYATDKKDKIVIPLLMLTNKICKKFYIH